MATIESDISALQAGRIDPPPLYNAAYDLPPELPPPESLTSSAENLSEHDPLVSRFTQHGEEILKNFLKAIRDSNIELVHVLLDSGHVDIEHDFDLELSQPLAIACQTGQLNLAREFIVRYGAQVNRMSFVGRDAMNRPVMRTPLMLAAERGSKPLCKMLIEEYGADDSIVAPDGMLALRLAVRGGSDNKEVIEYLPVRRGGGWRRFKNDHDVAMRRVKRTVKTLYIVGKFFVWDIPKFLVYDIPKWLLKGLGKLGKKTGRLLIHFLTKQLPAAIAELGRGIQIGATKLSDGIKLLSKLIFEFIKSLPSLAFRLARFLSVTTPKFIYEMCCKVAAKTAGWMKHFFTVAVPKACVAIWQYSLKAGAAIGKATIAGAKAVREFFFVTIPHYTVVTAKATWRFFTIYLPRFIRWCSKTTWRITKFLAKWMWKILTVHIPNMVVSAAKGIWRGIVATYELIAKGLNLTFSAIHTFVTFLITQIRAVTFADVMSAVFKIFQFVFMDVPEHIWKGLVATYTWLEKAFIKAFGFFGQVLVFLGKCSVSAVLFLPLLLLHLIMEFAQWVGRGLQEVAVWINPKASVGR